MKNSKLRKVLLLACSAVLLVCLSVGATLAYLTSTDTVVNTFTVGNVKITLDEYKTDLYGVVNTATPRVQTNEYKLIPGHEYAKDPTIHVTAGSEKCILFVKVTNGIAGIEADTTIAKQMEDLDWEPVTGAEGVYYYEYVVNATDATRDVDVPVFRTFTISGTEDVSGYATVKDEEGKIIGGATIKVIAYAVQADGFDADKNNAVDDTEALKAWTDAFGTL